ncbi:type II secretion system minor pseudopilin GspH [Pseudomonas protegens]|uniref:type II secretion system minor pseudopilin GspH n=1 Tax=Pseudomonas protegens TaxID=380021 RepID=UPI0029370758|nr:type II secretion system minor pseudopilin GspH [Pseudomonas protegens]WOE77412.1 type II secretion system minor pseudopilin GspH [Pseudomonas protegens]
MQHSQSKGFTLVEVLVVVLIIALSAGMIGLINPDSGSRQARREGDRLLALLQLLRQQAVLSNSDYGLRIDPDAYSVMRLDEQGQWLADRDWRAQTLPSSLRLRLEVAEAGPALGQASSRSTTPQLLVLSSDESSAFTLWIEHRNAPLLTLSSDGIQEPRLETSN